MDLKDKRYDSTQRIKHNQQFQNYKPGVLELITFDDHCDDLQEPFQEKNSNCLTPVQNSKLNKSKNQQRNKKFDQYITDRKTMRSQVNLKKKLTKNTNSDQFGKTNGKLIKQIKQIQDNEKTHRQKEKFIIAFDKKPALAIQQQLKRGNIKQQTPKAIAKYLFDIEGLNKVALGQYFGKDQQMNLKVLHEYCNLMNFHDLQFDDSLRKLLRNFRLPGQSQQIQRVVWQFSKAFYEVNTDLYKNAQQLHILSYAIIMLATDAHNPKQQKKMTKDQFIKMTRNGCPSIEEQLLTNIYYRTVSEKLETQSSYLQNLYRRLRDISQLNLQSALHQSKELQQGDIFLKACKNNTKFVQRKVFLSYDQKKIMWVADPPKYEQDPRWIAISEITDLNLGTQSQVMKKNKVPEQFDSLCFTIISKSRTLDLKASSTKIRAKWVNYLRAILIQRRQQRRIIIEKQHNQNWNSDKIEDIWNTQIFPLWDKHWDYKNKRPKVKGYIARGLQKMCGCWKNPKNEGFDEKYQMYSLDVKSTLLQTLWRYGLPPASRKILWNLVIGNNLALTPHMLEQIKKRKKNVLEFRKTSFCKEVIEIGEILLAVRPDLPAVKDVLLVSEVFYRVIPQTSNPLFGIINLIHTHHFLSFYRRDLTQIDLRIRLFEFLLEKNVKSVFTHFQALKLQTKNYLYGWFLSVFSGCFSEEFLYRVWDNFLLEGQYYLFKAGISLIKYYQIELKMCTFDEGLNILRSKSNMSPILFFYILQNQIDVKDEYYQQYIQKRKQAIIKTKVQAIPLE